MFLEASFFLSPVIWEYVRKVCVRCTCAYVQCVACKCGRWKIHWVFSSLRVGKRRVTSQRFVQVYGENCFFFSIILCFILHVKTCNPASSASAYFKQNESVLGISLCVVWNRSQF